MTAHVRSDFETRSVYSRAETTPHGPRLAMRLRARLLVASAGLTSAHIWWDSAPCGFSLQDRSRIGSRRGAFLDQLWDIILTGFNTFDSTGRVPPYVSSVIFSALSTSRLFWQWTGRWTASITPWLRKTASCSPPSRWEKDTRVRTQHRSHF